MSRDHSQNENDPANSFGLTSRASRSLSSRYLQPTRIYRSSHDHKSSRRPTLSELTTPERSIRLKMADAPKDGARGGGFGSRGGDRGGDRGRGRGRRGPRRGANKNEEKEWQPVTKLGRLVKDGKIKSMEEIYLHSLPIKEYQIVDFFLPKLKDEVMKV